jgi:cytochrome c oxidase subunit 2
MFSGPSSFVNSVDTAFWIVMIISVFFLVVITFTMVFFVIKYNRKRSPKATNIHGNIPLEITWTLIPTLLVLVMFYYGWIGYKQMADIPKDAYPINVTAQMWKWTFQYPNGVKADSLFVPVNTDVKCNLKSLDVNHSFFIPAFRVKKDVIPGEKRDTWFRAEKLGTYELTCAEYCGLNHWHMYTKVIVLPSDQFHNWLDNQAKTDSLNNIKNAAKQQTDSTKTDKKN